MMDCAAQTALEVLQSKGIDAVPGIIIVVHTFGRDLKFNPHVHMLMTEGGLTSDKHWVDIPFLPYGLLRKKWQYYLLTEIKAVLVQTRETARFIDMLFQDNRNGFYVNGASKMTSARYAARYIGRYVARPALAEYKITAYDGRSVTFWYASHETGNRVYESVGALEFIKRLLDHIPVKGFKMVRHYGLYARRTKAIAREVLRRCTRFVQMSFEFMKNRAGVLSWRERLLVSFGKDPLLCTTCNEEVLLWRIWHPVYGVIFDLSRDAPASTAYEKEQREKTQNTVAGPRWDGQLCLLPV